ncbi:3-oxoacyl-ACP reductase FabG [soil metagenome]
MPLTGKVALVTGASQLRSIGWGIAKSLAEAGADVVVNDAYHLEDLQARAYELRALSRRSLAIQADVTIDAQVNAMVAQTVQDLGRLDIVVSNAGIIRWERFPNITPDNLKAILRVNILGNVNVCRAAAKHMVAQGEGGRIVIVSSVQSDVQFPVTPIYGASKHAMHTFVGSVALELAPYKITVNHIGPGWVRSPLNDAAPDQQTPADIAAQRDAVPLGRAGLIEEMGAAVSYFSSPQAAYTTGAFLRVDGGLGTGKYL